MTRYKSLLHFPDANCRTDGLKLNNVLISGTMKNVEEIRAQIRVSLINLPINLIIFSCALQFGSSFNSANFRMWSNWSIVLKRPSPSAHCQSASMFPKTWRPRCSKRNGATKSCLSISLMNFWTIPNNCGQIEKSCSLWELRCFHWSIHGIMSSAIDWLGASMNRPVYFFDYLTHFQLFLRLPHFLSAQGQIRCSTAHLFHQRCFDVGRFESDQISYGLILETSQK